MGTNYVKKARTVRLPVVTDMQVNAFSSGAVTEVGSYIFNGILLQYPDKKWYVTQRPSVSTAFDPDTAATPVTDDRGRGLYYWAQPGAGSYVVTGYVDPTYVTVNDLPDLYIVNAAVVYKGSYDTACGGASMTTGVKRVYTKELANDIVIVDPENNQMFRINSGDADWLISMQTYSDSSTDVSFTAATDKITTAGAQDFSTLGIGDTITVSTTSGTNDGTYTIESVTATEIVVVETGVIADETAVAAGTTVIASTNYSALPQNNSLSLADGVAVLDQTMYVLDTNGSVWGCNLADASDWDDALNFVTAEREEDAGVFICKHHNHIVVFGTHTIEFFYDAGNATGSPLATREDVSYNIGCADPQSVWQSGDDVYFLGRSPTGKVQAYHMQNFEIKPISTSGLSSYFSASGYTYLGSGFTAGGIQYYVLSVVELQAGDPVAIETSVYNSNTGTWTDWDYAEGSIEHFPLLQFTNTSTQGFGQFLSGEVISIADNYDPEDDSTAITMVVRMDNFDADSRDWKYAHQLRYVGDAAQSSSNLTVKWADDNNASYSTGRTIDISNSKDKLTRLGRFKSRSHELSFSGSEQIRMEAIDLDITEGTH